MSQPKQSTARLSIFSIPLEIRREIYRYLLVDENAEIWPRFESLSIPDIPWDQYYRLCPYKDTHRAILRTCRRIHEGEWISESFLLLLCGLLSSAPGTCHSSGDSTLID